MIEKPRKFPLDDHRKCPDAGNHTPCPDGYIAWHEWAEKKMRTHDQVKCEHCGLFTIWKKKPKETTR